MFMLSSLIHSLIFILVLGFLIAHVFHFDFHSVIKDLIITYVISLVSGGLATLYSLYRGYQYYKEYEYNY